MQRLAASSYTIESRACRAASRRVHVYIARPKQCCFVARSGFNEPGSSASPPPPPPPPPPGTSSSSEQQQYGWQQSPDSSSTEPQAEMSLADFKEKVLRPVYLPASFVLGALTLGLRTATINFEFGDDPVSFIGCTLSTGLLTMALAWVLFDFVDDPPEGGNFSSPK